MMATKPVWQKPELTVLVRRRPEEAVLTACKVQGAAGPVKNHCKAQSGPGSCLSDVGT
jgi:hypothetical protein